MKKLALIGTAVVLAGIAGFSFRDKPQQNLPEIAIPTDGAVKELPVVKNEAFTRGEVLSFRMHYGIIDAGVATLAVTDEVKEIGGRKTYHIVGIGQSKGTFDFFYKVRDRYETYVDEKAVVPWLFQRRVYEGGYVINQDYIFNHYAKKVNVGEGKVYDIEPNMQDMLSAFYHARTMDLSNAKPGDIFELSCFMDKEIYPLKIKFIGRENVTIKKGTFRCLKFRPIMQKGRVFKNEEDLNVWLTDDKNHIPVKGQADVVVGSIKMELTDYTGVLNPIAKIK
jgi:hypothetical protein